MRLDNAISCQRNGHEKHTIRTTRYLYTSQQTRQIANCSRERENKLKGKEKKKGKERNIFDDSSAHTAIIASLPERLRKNKGKTITKTKKMKRIQRELLHERNKTSRESPEEAGGKRASIMIRRQSDRGDKTDTTKQTKQNQVNHKQQARNKVQYENQIKFEAAAAVCYVTLFSH